MGDCRRFYSLMTVLFLLSQVSSNNLQLIRDLHEVTQSNMDEDQSRGTQLLEIYALEIQMHNQTRNYKKLKVNLFFFFFKTKSIKLKTGNIQCV